MRAVCLSLTIEPAINNYNMSLKEKYHLTFFTNIENGAKYNFCQSSFADYAVLSFLSDIDKFDSQELINDLNECMRRHTNIDEGYLSDPIEYMTIDYEYPNVNINDVLCMPMSDLEGLLQEWLSYISQ